MVTNPIIEAIKSRRAIRSYEEKPVSESAIQTMLEAATYAPSAINVQPWKFTIISNKEKIKHYSDIAKPAMLQTLPDIEDENLARFRANLTNPKYNIFYNAPLLIFISGVKSPFAVYDCSMAAQNMMLTGLLARNWKLLDRNGNAGGELSNGQRGARRARGPSSLRSTNIWLSQRRLPKSTREKASRNPQTHRLRGDYDEP